MTRPCTCHADDKPPVPCPRRFALSDCRAAAMKGAAIDRMSEPATVYRGGKRRYFTLNAALRAEARMIIRQHCRAAGDDYRAIDPYTLDDWTAHLAAKIRRGNRQFNLADPLDREASPDGAGCWAPCPHTDPATPGSVPNIDAIKGGKAAA